MNNTIFYFFYNLAHQSLFVDKAIVFFAVYFPYIVIFSAGVFLLMHHEVFKAKSTLQILLQKKKEIFGAFLTGAFAYLLSFIFKLFFHTDRPFDLLAGVKPLFFPTDYSFPSGHATFFFGLAFSLFFNHRNIGIIFLIFAFLISIARVMAGVHFPVDILGGLFLGFIVSFVINFINKK
jgi:membrane-associated phospholipid phosphatase